MSLARRQPLTVFGLTGWSGSGKTTLITRLIPVLKDRGLTVSTIKHAHKGFDMDRPGKDSYCHREAGAAEVLVTSPQRWVLQHELRDGAEPTLEELLGKLAPVDLVLVEGFKRDRHAKLEVWRPGLARPLLAADDPTIVALASDGAIDGATVPVLDLNDPEAIAGFICRHIGWAG